MMNVYHMSQTLRIGDRPIPDHSRHLEHALPFIQALERSEDCFYAMLLQGKFLRSVFERSQLRREWVNYAKWATEAVFEFVRRKEFPGCVSRLQCNYFYSRLEDVQVLFRYDWGSDSEEAALVHIYEIELDDDAPQYYDMRLYDLAYDAMEDAQDVSAVFRYARRYFAGEQTENPVMELMSDKNAVITKELTELHEELMRECFAARG